MNNNFNINITDRIEITSALSYDHEFDVIVYNKEKSIIYSTPFTFNSDVVFWISINQLENILIHIVDNGNVIFKYTNIDLDFVYVTCGDLYFMDLMEKLVISLLNTSTKKIIVYGINCKVPFDYPNLIKKEFHSPLNSLHDKWYWKQQVCIESMNEGSENFVWVDGDIICNNNIDSVSKYFIDIENYPISNTHVQEELFFIENGVISEQFNENLCRTYNVTRKILKHFLHVCFYVYNKDCKWFFQEILDLYYEILRNGKYDDLLRWNDEGLHNFLQCKYNFTKTLPMSDCSLASYNGGKFKVDDIVLNRFYEYWNNDSPNNFGLVFGCWYIPEDKNQILVFHENKNLEIADECILFTKLKKNGFYNSKCFFIDKYKINNFENKKLNNNLDSKYFECTSFEYKDLCYLKPNDLVVDIGSDIGFFERYSYLKLVSEIICFEPNKSKFELLKLNVSPITKLFNADLTGIVGDNTYSIDYLFESELLDHIDYLKIDNKGKEFDILNINNNNYQKISRISIKYYHQYYNYDNTLRENLIKNTIRNGYNSMLYTTGDIDYIFFYK